VRSLHQQRGQLGDAALLPHNHGLLQHNSAGAGALKGHMEGGHLPLVPPGLVYGTALAPADEDAGDLCRICFGPDESDATGNPADQFISPCKCSGKLQSIFAVQQQSGTECHSQCTTACIFTRRPVAHMLP
jgi:RING-variant domain